MPWSGPTFIGVQKLTPILTRGVLGVIRSMSYSSMLPPYAEARQRARQSKASHRGAMRAFLWMAVVAIPRVGGQGVCGEDSRLQAEAAGSQWVRQDTRAPGGRQFHAIAAAEHGNGLYPFGGAATVRACCPAANLSLTHAGVGGWEGLGRPPRKRCIPHAHAR